MGLFKQPDNPPACAEIFRPEQFDIGALGPEPCAVGNNEAGITAIGLVVDRTRREFLAAAVRPADQHPAGCRSDTLNGGAYIFHRG